MSPMKTLISTLRDLADAESCVFSASDLAGVLPGCGQVAVVLSRAVKAGVLRRVGRGIYFYPVPGYRQENLLFHAAAKLRAGELNYLSLETVLSEAGVISQIPMNSITLMSSGRSHVVRCGYYGRIEFVHTEQRAGDLVGRLSYDRERRLWIASAQQAMRDLRVTGRSRELVNEEVLGELV